MSLCKRLVSLLHLMCHSDMNCFYITQKPCCDRKFQSYEPCYYSTHSAQVVLGGPDTVIPSPVGKSWAV